MSDSEGTPHFRELDRTEIDTILARNNVGRIAYARKNQVNIQPVHYVFSDGWIIGRTSYGAKFDALGETAYRWWPVAFEVDEVKDIFDWRSVVVQGGFFVLDPDGAPPERQAWEEALELVRTLNPKALRKDDPTPFRTVLFRISVQEATGREALPAAPEPGEPTGQGAH